VRADSPEVRAVLGAVAVAAVLEDGIPGLSREEMNRVARESGTQLLASAAPIAEAQGALGRVEGLVAAANTRQEAERTSLGILMNEMVTADPFQTASELAEIETQLQISYQLTARIADLTLGRVDKRGSHTSRGVIQAGICDGDQLGTRPDVGRGVGVL